eukprot:10106918-Prorocentrum_lima.AAC.1
MSKADWEKGAPSLLLAHGLGRHTQTAGPCPIKDCVDRPNVLKDSANALCATPSCRVNIRTAKNTGAHSGG